MSDPNNNQINQNAANNVSQLVNNTSLDHVNQNDLHNAVTLNTIYHNENQGFVSEIEIALRNAKQPLDNLKQHEIINAGPYRGVYLNKHEVDAWRGPVPIDQYHLHDDSNPEVIRKRLDKVRYTQELSVRYLNPPPAPKPGDIIIREKQVALPPAPPLIVRQEGERSTTPPPIIFREVPPPPPPRIDEQVIEIEGQAGPAPPRRVIVERMSNLPPRPQDIIVEKWLPYRPQKRRVVFQRAAAVQSIAVPRNLIIEWEAPDVEIINQCKDLGVVDADPEDYRRRFGADLKQSHDLPTCVSQAVSRAASNATSVVSTSTSVSFTTQQQPVYVAPQPTYSAPQPTYSSLQPTYSAPQPTYSAPQPTYTASTNSSYVAQSPCNNTVNSGQGAPVAKVPNGNCTVQEFSQYLASSNHSAVNAVPELEGEVNALRLVDLNRHGLQQYSNYVSK